MACLNSLNVGPSVRLSDNLEILYFGQYFIDSTVHTELCCTVSKLVLLKLQFIPRGPASGPNRQIWPRGSKIRFMVPSSR
jgi:hypothetical protein